MRSEGYGSRLVLTGCGHYERCLSRNLPALPFYIENYARIVNIGHVKIRNCYVSARACPTPLAANSVTHNFWVRKKVIFLPLLAF